MLDPLTGNISFEEPATVIRKTMKRSDFLVSLLATGASTLIENEPNYSWSIGIFLSHGIHFHVDLCFKGNNLHKITLMDTNPKYGTRWADWSLENEMARKACHDQWLTWSIHGLTEFPWGRVWSVYDQIGGFSSIQIQYDEG